MATSIFFAHVFFGRFALGRTCPSRAAAVRSAQPSCGKARSVRFNKGLHRQARAGAGPASSKPAGTGLRFSLIRMSRFRRAPQQFLDLQTCIRLKIKQGKLQGKPVCGAAVCDDSRPPARRWVWSAVPNRRPSGAVKTLRTHTRVHEGSNVRCPGCVCQARWSRVAAGLRPRPNPQATCIR